MTMSPEVATTAEITRSAESDRRHAAVLAVLDALDIDLVPNWVRGLTDRQRAELAAVARELHLYAGHGGGMSTV